MIKAKKLRLIKKRGYDNPSLSQAKKRADWPEWEKAIKTEYDQMISDGVFLDWDMKQLTSKDKLVGSMLVLLIKRRQDGSIDKYTARCCD
jgi:hypothetical protein